MGVAKLAAAAFATWMANVLFALVLFAVVAGTSGKSVRSGEQAVMLLLFLTAAEMLASVGLVWLAGQRFVAEAGVRIVVVLLFGVAQVVSFAALGFLFLVGFNR